ncbi:MAG: hypothetical protein ACKVP5_21075 [Aestuariivirga sp.]
MSETAGVLEAQGHGADTDPFPMPVNRFLKEANQHLMRGDIIVSRSATLSSWAIRLATGGVFSHAALVFLVPDPEDGFENTFLLESVSEGVGIANFRSYLERKAATDVGILRLDAPWYDAKLRKLIRGVMLDHVKSGYDFKTAMRIWLAVAFGARLGWFRIRKGRKSSMANAVRTAPKRWVPPQFICSGFVQYGFVELLRRMGLDPQLAIFHEGLDPTDQNGLLAVTPDDIAKSKKLTWSFVVRRGWVHRAASFEQAVKSI